MDVEAGEIIEDEGVSEDEASANSDAQPIEVESIYSSGKSAAGNGIEFHVIDEE